MPEPRSEWGARVRARRIEQGLRQEDLAAEAGIAQSFLSKVELGQAGTSYDVRVRIAKALGTTAAELFPYIEQAS